MIRTMVYLPDALHRAVRHLAVERGTSMAKLVTEALEALYQEDVDDLKAGRERLVEYLVQPSKVIPYSTYRIQRLKK